MCLHLLLGCRMSRRVEKMCKPQSGNFGFPGAIFNVVFFPFLGQGFGEAPSEVALCLNKAPGVP